MEGKKNDSLQCPYLFKLPRHCFPFLIAKISEKDRPTPTCACSNWQRDCWLQGQVVREAETQVGRQGSRWAGEKHLRGRVSRNIDRRDWLRGGKRERKAGAPASQSPHREASGIPSDTLPSCLTWIDRGHLIPQTCSRPTSQIYKGRWIKILFKQNFP